MVKLLYYFANDNLFQTLICSEGGWSNQYALHQVLSKKVVGTSPCCLAVLCALCWVTPVGFMLIILTTCSPCELCTTYKYRRARKIKMRKNKNERFIVASCSYIKCFTSTKSYWQIIEQANRTALCKFESSAFIDLTYDVVLEPTKFSLTLSTSSILFWWILQNKSPLKVGAHAHQQTLWTFNVSFKNIQLRNKQVKLYRQGGRLNKICVNRNFSGFWLLYISHGKQNDVNRSAI